MSSNFHFPSNSTQQVDSPIPARKVSISSSSQRKSSSSSSSSSSTSSSGRKLSSGSTIRRKSSVTLPGVQPIPRRSSIHKAPLPPPPPGSHYHRKLSTHMGDIQARFVFDFKKAVPRSLERIDWSKAAGFTTSEEGSEGVFFVQFVDNTAVVVKGSSTIAADMFAQDLANYINLLIPKFDVYRYGVDPDFMTVFKTLNKLDANNALGKRGRHQKSLDRPLFQVMQYVAGKDLEHISYKDIFGQPEHGAIVLREIGRINSYDVLINNWDRLPLIWDNEGNSGNILFVRDSTRKCLVPLALDNTLTCIDASLSENFSEYLDKVRCIINEMAVYFRYSKQPYFEGVRESFPITCFEKKPSVENIRTFLKSTVGYTMTDEEMKQFMFGFMEGAVAFSTLQLDQLNKMKDKIELDITPCLVATKMTPEAVGFGKIHLEFIDAVIKIYEEASPMMRSILDNEKSLPTQGTGSN